MNIILSIIIPIYNSQKYLEECLNSVINQNLKNVEIILVNDGSSDKSGQIAREYQENTENIILIEQKNQGVSSARNKGILNARGKYIMFIDSDDYISLDALSKIKNLLKYNQEYDLIMFGLISGTKAQKLYLSINGFLNQEITNLKQLIPKLIYHELLNSPVNKIYNREIIINNNIFFDMSLDIAEDLLFNTQYISKINNFYCLSTCLYTYRVDAEGSLTKRFREDKYEQLIYVNNYSREILKNIKTQSLIKSLNYIRFKNIHSCLVSLEVIDAEDRIKQLTNIVKREKAFFKSLNFKNIGYHFVLKYIYYNNVLCHSFYKSYYFIRRFYVS